jgi:hypothetical protein
VTTDKSLARLAGKDEVSLPPTDVRETIPQLIDLVDIILRRFHRTQAVLELMIGFACSLFGALAHGGDFLPIRSTAQMGSKYVVRNHDPE